MTQQVKNTPAMRETWVQSLGWEDPLEKGKATHSSILAWRIPKDSPWVADWQPAGSGCGRQVSVATLSPFPNFNLKTKKMFKELSYMTVSLLPVILIFEVGNIERSEPDS